MSAARPGPPGPPGRPGAAGQTQTIVQEKVVTVEKPVVQVQEKVVTQVVTVEKQVVVEKPAERIVPKKLEFWAVDYADGSALNYGRKAMHDNVRRWNEQSNDSFVSLNPRPSGHHMEKLIASYAAGTQPQLILWPSWHAGLFAIAGVLVDVQDRFIKADKNFAAQLDDFYEPVLQSMYFRGKLFSLEIAPNGGPALYQPQPGPGSGAGAARVGLHLGRPGGLLRDDAGCPGTGERVQQVGDCPYA